MAFYGRVTNESKTSMTFDRVYPNRVTMNAKIDEDGVFNGRFVLVEYDIVDDTITYDDATDDTEIYNKNYNKDKEAYPKLGRGYDSTVWRKVINADGEAYYVMLAELNSVVPSFGITPLAPSDEPIKPEFGGDSSNVYYDLQLGSTWGFDVGEIQYNKAGLNIDTHTESIAPSNEHIYFDNVASGAFANEEGNLLPDTKQLHINIPEIGNMVGEGWDRIYGYNPEDNKRNTSVMWKDAAAAEVARPLAYANGAIIQDALIQTDGEYNGSIGSPAHIDNLADAIRYVYDTLGMIIEPISLADYLEPATVARPLSDTSPGYIYYLSANDEEIDESEDLTTDEKEQLKAHRFLWLEEKYNFDDDDEYTSESDEGLVKGRKPYPVNQDAILDFPPEDLVFLQIDKDIPYYKRVDSNTAVSEKEYYTLDLSLFTEQTKYTASDSNFKDLIISHTLYKKSIDNNTGSIILTEIVDEDEVYDDELEYFIIPNINPDLDSDPDLPGFSAAIFRTTYGQGKNIFFDEKGNAYNEGSFRELANGTPIYLKEEPEEHYDDEEKKWVITNVYTQVGVKGSTLSDCSRTATVDNTHILSWPLNNNKTGESTWDPDEETEAQQAAHFWIGSTDDETGARVFTLQANRPEEEIADGVKNRIAALMIVGKQPTGGGYGDQDRRTDNLYTLTGIQSVSDFIMPNEDFWVYYEDEGLVYKITDEMMPLPEAHYAHVYKIDDSEFEIADGDPIRGVNGQQKITTATPQYYFVPNQLYELQAGEYVKATHFTDGTQYYTVLDLCVKEDLSGQFNVGEKWNANLNLDTINSPETVVTLGYKTSQIAFFPLDGYAKDLNTINGIILAMNKKLGADDPNSRDTSTVQGLINALNDKLEKLDDTPGNSLVVTDQYGHLDSVQKTEDGSSFITTPVTETTTWNGIEVPNPIEANENLGGIAGVEGNDSWITADIITNSNGDSFAYILHNTVDVDDTPIANATDLNDGTDTIILHDIQYDNAGHITGDHAHTYTLPYGFKSFTAGSATVVADSTQDTITFNGDSWIDITANASNDTLTFTHAITATTSFLGGISATATATTALAFGDSFNIMDLVADTAGHLTTLSTTAITLPTISFGGGASSTSGGVGEVMTGLTFSNDGSITATYTAVGSLTNLATSTTTSTDALTSSDSLADALKKLENRIQGLNSTVTCSDVDGIEFTLTQSEGELSTFTASVNWTTVGETVATAALSAGTFTTMPTTSISIADAIDSLQTQINNLITQAGAYSYENNAYIFRQGTAPTASESPVNNTIYSGWIWIDTNNNYIYFCPATSSGTVSWELLNSWR